MCIRDRSYIDGAARGDLMSRVVTDVDMISDGPVSYTHLGV